MYIYVDSPTVIDMIVTDRFSQCRMGLCQLQEHRHSVIGTDVQYLPFLWHGSLPCAIIEQFPQNFNINWQLYMYYTLNTLRNDKCVNLDIRK